MTKEELMAELRSIRKSFGHNEQDWKIVEGEAADAVYIAWMTARMRIEKLLEKAVESEDDSDPTLKPCPFCGGDYIYCSDMPNRVSFVCRLGNWTQVQHKENCRCCLER